jgi:hypothetical protein
MVSFLLTVPADNKPGALSRVTALLGKEKINIRAVNITSFGESGYFHLVVDDPEGAHTVLKNAGIDNHLKKVIAVLIEDKPGSLNVLIDLLYKNGINVENACGFVLESYKKAVFVVDVDRLDEALKLLEKEKFKTLDPESLNAVEPFHYMKY